MEWNEQRVHLRQAIEQYPGLVMDSLDAAYLAGLEARHERVICAAVKATDGTVVIGHRHSYAIQTLHGIPGLEYRYGDGTTQGFITSTGRYVDRIEGFRIQQAAGVKSVDPGGYRGDELYSEDLY